MTDEKNICGQRDITYELKAWIKVGIVISMLKPTPNIPNSDMVLSLCRDKVENKIIKLRNQDNTPTYKIDSHAGQSNYGELYKGVQHDMKQVKLIIFQNTMDVYIQKRMFDDVSVVAKDLISCFYTMLGGPSLETPDQSIRFTQDDIEFMRIDPDGSLVFNRDDFDITPKEMASLFKEHILDNLKPQNGNDIVFNVNNGDVAGRINLEKKEVDFPMANMYDSYTHWFVEALEEII